MALVLGIFRRHCVAVRFLEHGHKNSGALVRPAVRDHDGYFCGVEHFLHPAGCPGVPLEKLMPAWIPGRLLIGYLTGAILLVAGASILLARKKRMAATYLGIWIVLLVLFIYGPILIAQMSDPSTAVKVEGINYFADTLLFAGAILALAGATPRTD